MCIMNRTGLIVLGDFLAFWISFILLIFIRFSPSDYNIVLNNHFSPFLILYLSWVLIFYVFGLYDLLTIKPTIPYIKRWFLALISSFFVGLLLFYFVPIFGISPKINLIIQVSLFGLFSFTSRRVIYSLFARTMIRPMILVGNSTCLTELKNTITTNPQIGLQIIEHLPSINDLKLNINNTNAVIILDKDIKGKDGEILNLYQKNVEVIDTAQAYEKYLLKIPIKYIDISFIIEKINIQKDIFYKIITFVFDKLLALMTITITSPFISIAILAKFIEDGKPIFIKQERIGLNNKIFKLYKLRSMIVLSENGLAEKDGAEWSSGLKDDPRITKVGKIIRKTHIDEIPQMINVLKGDISIVGPRPERPEFVKILEEKIPYYSFRHIIKPGFTGWAQIKYHYANTEDESKEKFEYDLYYLKNRNIFLDIGIVLRTIQIIFTH